MFLVLSAGGGGGLCTAFCIQNPFALSQSKRTLLFLFSFAFNISNNVHLYLYLYLYTLC